MATRRTRARHIRELVRRAEIEGIPVPPRILDELTLETPVDPENPTFVPLEDMEVFQTTPERNAANMAIAAMATPATPLVVGDPVYERQASLGLSSPSVMIVGCGGVGVWVALALALGGVERLSLWDGDTLSQNNLNRFPLPPSLVGEMKSVALAGWLSSLRPGVEEIRARGEFDPLLHNESPESYSNWLVCATDSLKSRRMCYAFAKEREMYYIEVGADGERWSLSPAPPEFSTEGEDAPGYRSVPVHVGPCMMAGAAVAYHVLHNKTPLYTHTGNWDKGPVMDDHRANLASLDFVSLSEENIPEVTASHKCPHCQRPVEDSISLISLIGHLKKDKPEWGIVEAKTEAERLMREWGFVAPAQLRQTVVRVYPATPEGNEARAHDLYIMDNPGDFDDEEVMEANDRLTRERDNG